jgi:hypothetical protein
MHKLLVELTKEQLSGGGTQTWSIMLELLKHLVQIVPLYVWHPMTSLRQLF